MLLQQRQLLSFLLGIIKGLLHLESKNSCSRCHKIKLTCLQVTAGLLSHCLDGMFSEGPFKRNKSSRCVYESSVLSSYNLKWWRFLLSLGKLNSSNSWGFFNKETLNFYIYFNFYLIAEVFSNMLFICPVLRNIEGGEVKRMQRLYM